MCPGCTQSDMDLWCPIWTVPTIYRRNKATWNTPFAWARLRDLSHLIFFFFLVMWPLQPQKHWCVLSKTAFGILSMLFFLMQSPWGISGNICTAKWMSLNTAHLFFWIVSLFPHVLLACISVWMQLGGARGFLASLHRYSVGPPGPTGDLRQA